MRDGRELVHDTKDVRVVGEPLAGRETTQIRVYVGAGLLFSIDCPDSLDPAGLAQLLQLWVATQGAACSASGAASEARVEFPAHDRRRLELVRAEPPAA